MLELTACKAPVKSKHVFAPQKLTNVPNIKFPVNEPIDNIDPIQEISSFERGPEVNGVSLDFSNGNAGETHPIPQPYPSTIKFTRNAKNSILNECSQRLCGIGIFNLKIHLTLQRNIGILHFETRPFHSPFSYTQDFKILFIAVILFAMD